MAPPRSSHTWGVKQREREGQAAEKAARRAPSWRIYIYLFVRMRDPAAHQLAAQQCAQQRQPAPAKLDQQRLEEAKVVGLRKSAGGEVKLWWGRGVAVGSAAFYRSVSGWDVSSVKRMTWPL